jgi:hypothetical protein
MCYPGLAKEGYPNEVDIALRQEYEGCRCFFLVHDIYKYFEVSDMVPCDTMKVRIITICTGTGWVGLLRPGGSKFNVSSAALIISQAAASQVATRPGYTYLCEYQPTFTFFSNTKNRPLVVACSHNLTLQILNSFMVNNFVGWRWLCTTHFSGKTRRRLVRKRMVRMTDKISDTIGVMSTAPLLAVSASRRETTINEGDNAAAMKNALFLADDGEG